MDIDLEGDAPAQLIVQQFGWEITNNDVLWPVDLPVWVVKMESSDEDDVREAASAVLTLGRARDIKPGLPKTTLRAKSKKSRAKSPSYQGSHHCLKSGPHCTGKGSLILRGINPRTNKPYTRSDGSMCRACAMSDVPWEPSVADFTRRVKDKFRQHHR